MRNVRFEWQLSATVGRGHVTAILICILSKIQTRQWFVTNYSNNCCLDYTMHTEDFTIFSLDMNFVRWPRRAMSITNFNISNYQV